MKIMTWRFGVMFALALLLGACRPQALGQPDVVIVLLTYPSTPVTGASSITVLLRDTSGQAIHGAYVVVEGTATFPRTAPVLATAIESAPGIYATNLVWPQPGNWNVIVHAALASGDTLQRQIDMPYVQAR